MLRTFSRTAILSIFFAAQFPALARASANPTPQESVEIPFTIGGGYLIEVHGSIGARQNLKFVVDLSTPYTLIDRKLLSQLNLRNADESGRPADQLSKNEAILPMLRIGDLNVPNFHVYIADLSEIPVAPAGTAGILGADFLSRQNVTFNFASRKITFSAKVSGRHSVPFERVAVGYAVETNWRNHPLKLVLSNGVEVVTLDGDRMKGESPQLRGLKPGTLETSFSVTPVTLFKVNDLAVNDMHLHGEGVLRKVDWPVASDHLDGFLPIAALRASRVSLDFGRGLLLWDSVEDKIERAQDNKQLAGANSLKDN